MIKAAAVKLKDGTILEGKSHYECMKQMREHCYNNQQGFITTEGRFVDRKEAGRIAYIEGQIKGNPKGDIIISEEIWLHGNCYWDEETTSYKFNKEK